MSSARRRTESASRCSRGSRSTGRGGTQWNFEKFLVRPDGTVAARFRPRTDPEDPAVVAAIEANLPG